MHTVVSEHFEGRLKTVSCGKGSERITFLHSEQLMERTGLSDECLSKDDRLSSKKPSPPIPASPSAAKGKRPTKQLYQPPSAQKQSSDSSSTSQTANNPVTKDDDDDDWDALYDDSGECIKPDIVKEFKNVLKLDDEKSNGKQGKKIEKNKMTFESASSGLSDYCLKDGPASTSSVLLTDNEYAHVLEIYDFASDLKTPDLFTRIASAGSTDFEIVWVDDTHALAVFGSEVTANAALRFTFPDLKVRVLSQATSESRLKARRSTDRLLPFKKRPQTSLDAARRLVGRHLGLKVQVSREQLEAEKKVLQEAKDRRRQSKKQTNDIWEGNVD